MKKLIMILALVATSAFAEPSFTQVQDLIGRQQYSAAEQGLEQIIHNHPNSAKAYYSMAQAQAGLGNLDKARYALDKATGLDPTLAFASQSQVQSLREALTPQVKKIEMVEESHTVRNTILLIFLLGLCYVVYSVYRRNKAAEDDYFESSLPAGPDLPPSPPPKTSAEPIIKTVTPEVKKEEKVSVPPRGKETTVTYTTPAPQPVYAAPQPVHTTTVVNQSNDGLLTGMLIGNMLSNHHDHVIEREVVREVPSKSYESSSSRSSSWDSDSSSSSWDSDSSSSSSKSSSWDSDSSSSSSWSSSSDSSSSWDSGSSSSDSSW